MIKLALKSGGRRGKALFTVQSQLINADRMMEVLKSPVCNCDSNN